MNIKVWDETLGFVGGTIFCILKFGEETQIFGKFDLSDNIFISFNDIKEEDIDDNTKIYVHLHDNEIDEEEYWYSVKYKESYGSKEINEQHLPIAEQQKHLYIMQHLNQHLEQYFLAYKNAKDTAENIRIYQDLGHNKYNEYNIPKEKYHQMYQRYSKLTVFW